jgi:zinc protease
VNDRRRRSPARPGSVPLPALSILGLAGFLLGSAALHPAPAHASPPGGFLHEVLPNGMEVSILPDSSHPVVATRVWYDVGAANEDPGTRGFVHLFEHLMFGGTATHDKRDYWDLHHAFGGNGNAYTDWDETVYQSDIPPAGHARVLELEADRMVHLRIDQDNLDNEKRIVTEELRMSTENDPMMRVQIAALKGVLREHPYAVTPVGTREDIAAVRLDGVRDFYARYYKPRNAHLIVVGPVDGDSMRAEVGRVFGSLPAAGETPKDIPPLLGWPCPAEVDLKEDLPPAKIALLAYLLPPASAPDADAVAVLCELLAGGYANPWREDLVERRRKALFAESMRLDLRRGGAFVLISGVLPNRGRASQFRDMDESLKNLGRKEWLTDGSLAALKRRLMRRDENQDYFAAEQAEAIGFARWWAGDVARAFDRSERIGAVTRGQVAAAFDRYIGGAKPVRVHIQPEHVPVLVRMFGWLLPLFVHA